jgi:hypothetical protein
MPASDEFLDHSLAQPARDAGNEDGSFVHSSALVTNPPPFYRCGHAGFQAYVDTTGCY